VNTKQYTQKITTRSLIVYFLLAFGITWGLSIIATKDLLPFAIPVPLRNISGILLHYGPALAAIILVGVTGGRSSLREFLGKLGHWRVGIGWYLFVFLFPPLVHLAAVVIDVLLGGQWPPFMSAAAVGSPAGVNPAIFIPIVFLAVFFQAGLAEEIGWRGYALPGLQQRYGALTSSIILGIFWWLWHFHPVNFPAYRPTAFSFLFNILAFTILLTWIYNNTDGSILMAVLFHTVSNVCDWIIPTSMAAANITSTRPSIIQGILTWIFAIGIIMYFGAKQLSRKSPAKSQ
jgi:membrane protease YdiL (CAAX protease family)